MNDEPALDLCGVPPAAAAMVLEECDDTGNKFRLLVPRIGGNGGAYAIKDEDFPIIQASFAAVGAYFASEFRNWAPGTIAGLLLLLIEFHRKRVELTPLQAAILRELKESEGLTEAEVVSLVHFPALNMGNVRSELIKLTSVVNKTTGRAVELVKKNEHDKWFAAV
jgi:hypothetical protein